MFPNVKILAIFLNLPLKSGPSLQTKFAKPIRNEAAKSNIKASIAIEQELAV